MINEDIRGDTSFKKRHKGTVSSFTAQQTDHYSASQELFYPQRVILTIKKLKTQIIMSPLKGLVIVISRQYLDPGLLKSNPSITRKNHIIFLPRKRVKYCMLRLSSQGTAPKGLILKLLCSNFNQFQYTCLV